MSNIKIYENFGVLGAEKRTMYTFGCPSATAAAWNEMTVEIPRDWEYWENDGGEGMVTSPWGQNYTVNDVLCGDEFPHFFAYDNKMAAHKIMLKIIECK